MEFTDYYATLGVSRDATAEQVKAAYRKLARRLHPDVSKEGGAEARFKKVNEAYEVLKDPDKRAKYDRLGANWEELERQEEAMRQHRSRAGSRATAGPGDHSDFFETFFGGGGVDLDELFRQARSSGGSTTFDFRTRPHEPPRPRRGVDVEQEVPITLDEAMHGGVRLLTVGERQVEVRIPAGVTDGSLVRVGGEGGEGRNGGPPGDVMLRVRLRPHHRFRVRDRDVLGEVDVRDDQAVLGGSVDVPGLGGPLRVTVPAGSQSGRVLRLRGKGVPGLGGKPAGDLLLTLRVVVPRSPSDADVEHYRALADLRDGAAGKPAADD